MNQQHLLVGDLRQFRGRKPSVDFIKNGEHRIGIIENINLTQVIDDRVVAFTIELMWSWAIKESLPFVGLTVMRNCEFVNGSFVRGLKVEFSDPGRIWYRDSSIIISFKSGPLRITIEQYELGYPEGFITALTTIKNPP